MKKIKKHFLLAVSKDSTHQYGVRFLSYFFGNKNDVLVDVLNVTHKNQGSGYFSGGLQETSLKTEKSFLGQVRQRMIDFGFPAENIRTEARAGAISTAQDIIAHGRKGLYDALVLGRRGLTLLESLIQDSVSSKVLDEQCDLPLWICREPERQKKNVLLCTDGSRQSLNTADHVGFVLEAAPDSTITVLHVSTGAGEKQQEILDNTVAEILNNGYPRESIITLALEGSNPAEVILKYARINNFAVIAMGRKCQTSPRTGFSRFFVGSVSSDVLKNLERASLWICR